MDGESGNDHKINPVLVIRSLRVSADRNMARLALHEFSVVQWIECPAGVWEVIL